MEGGCICGDVMDAAMRPRRALTWFVTREAEWVTDGEAGIMSGFWSGVWDQLWSSVICQLSLRKLVCIHDYITVRRQAEVRWIGAVIRRGLFHRCSVTKNLSKKVGGVLEIKRPKSRISQKYKGKKRLSVLASALIVSLLSKWGNCHLDLLNCGTYAVCDCVSFCVSQQTQGELYNGFIADPATQALTIFFFFSLQHGNRIHLAKMESVSVQSATCFWFIKNHKGQQILRSLLDFFASLVAIAILQILRRSRLVPASSCRWRFIKSSCSKTKMSIN